MHTQRRIAAAALTTLGIGAALAGCERSSGPTAPASSPEATAAAPSNTDQAGTDPAPYRTRYGSLTFTTSWGAWCAILPKHDATPGTPTAGCWEITGKQQVLTVSPRSAAQIKQVQQGFYVYERGPALPAGAALELDGVRCVASAADLTCTAGTHAFTLRPDNSVDLR